MFDVIMCTKYWVRDCSRV